MARIMGEATHKINDKLFLVSGFKKAKLFDIDTLEELQCIDLTIEVVHFIGKNYLIFVMRDFVTNECYQ